ncbi:MAG: M20 family metallopeptidase [Desulfobacteraceae bacterium]|nr:M20 family metallopeptidase [Desulfobacteraceae bacterium]
MNQFKEKICREVDLLADELYAVSDFLLKNPETAYKEFKSAEHLSNILEKHGFHVEKGIGGIETAFMARPALSDPSRPCVAFLAEYDALPKIGHGCGHNMIAAASIGAVLVLHRIMKDRAGGLALVGTPAEEGGGGKAYLAEAGIFNETDAAIMFHPNSINIPGKNMLGRIKFKIEFHGQSAHASGGPDKGINALDALVIAYSSINAMRQKLKPDARIHGIITHGGDAPNIIPDYAAGLFYVRAETREYRDQLLEQVKLCGQGAALATGAEFKMEIYEPKLDPMKRNFALEGALKGNMDALGILPDKDDGRMGSSDIGNLSYYLPSIHPYLAVTGPDVILHTPEFRDATSTDRARKTLLCAAKVLAMTAYDFLTSSDLRDSVSKEFNE